MFNDDNQEDVTLENDVNEEVDESTDEEEVDESTENNVDALRAENKKLKAILARKAKKTEEVVAQPTASQALDQDLINLTYKNFLGGIGINNPSVQDEAINLAKRMGIAVSQIQSDPALMEVLQAKQKIAVTNNAMTKGTGGSALKKRDADFIASKVSNGGTLESISGKDAVAVLKRFKN